MSGDIEGAICDECGNRIGPSGCCATVRAANSRSATEMAALRKVRDEIAAIIANHFPPEAEGTKHMHWEQWAKPAQLVEWLAALDAILKERE